MNNHTKLFTQLADESIPPGLHEKIMRNVVARHYAKFPLPFLILFACNLLVIGWHIWTKLVDAEFFSVARALDDSFEWSFSFLSDAATTLFSILPLYSLLVFSINIALAGYLVMLIRKWHQVSLSSIT